MFMPKVMLNIIFIVEASMSYLVLKCQRHVYNKTSKTDKQRILSNKLELTPTIKMSQSKKVSD